MWVVQLADAAPRSVRTSHGPQMPRRRVPPLTLPHAGPGQMRSNMLMSVLVALAALLSGLALVLNPRFDSEGIGRDRAALVAGWTLLVAGGALVAVQLPPEIGAA